MQVKTNRVDGLEDAPKTMVRMLSGGKFGKALIHVAEY